MNKHNPTHSQNLAALTLGAVGVVYGDVGTSPLYTMKEIFNGPHAVEPQADNVLGILSLIFWALIFVGKGYTIASTANPRDVVQ